jgi:biotin operon repressor
MMMPEPIMLTITMNVSCTTFIFFCGAAIAALLGYARTT